MSAMTQTQTQTMPQTTGEPRVVPALAGEDPLWAEAYAREHRAALRRHGVDLPGAERPPEGQTLMALLLAGEELAGGLLLVPAEAGLLPMERQVGPVVKPAQRHAAAEVAGVFVAEPFRKGGASERLLCATLALAPLLGLRHLVLYTHQFSRPLYESFGFQPIPGLPEKIYPQEPYISTAMALPARLLALPRLVAPRPPARVQPSARPTLDVAG